MPITQLFSAIQITAGIERDRGIYIIALPKSYTPNQRKNLLNYLSEEYFLHNSIQRSHSTAKNSKNKSKLSIVF